MKKIFLALLLLSPSCSLEASWNFFSARKDPLAKEKELFKEGRYKEVINDLGHDQFQYYRGKNLSRAYFYLGQSYEYTDHLGRALGFYELGVKLFPKDLRLAASLALLLHRAGLETNAEPLFEKILRTHPNNAEAHLGLAEIDAHLGFLKRSAHHYQETLKSVPENADIWRHYAEVLMQLRKFSEAEVAAKKSLSLNPDPKTEMDTVFIERDEGHLDQALSLLDSPSLNSQYGVKAKRLKGLWLLEDKQIEKAILTAKNVQKISPEDPIAFWVLAQAALSRGQISKAKKELGRIRDSQKHSFVYKAAQALLRSLPEPRSKI